MRFWTRWSRSRPAFLLLVVPLGLGVCAVAAHAQRPPPPQANAADRELTVFNHAQGTINEIYVSPSTADQWGDDRLGDDTLDPGKSFKVKLGRVRDCEFDVQVVYEDGSHEESRRVNACRTRQLAFDGSTATAAPQTAQGEAHTVTLLNNAARPIQQVFISPADASQWGDDRLANDSISTGASAQLTYRGDCAADLRVVFDNKAAEERRGLNLCQTATLSIEPGWTTADAPPVGGLRPQSAGPRPEAGIPQAAIPPAAIPPAVSPLAGKPPAATVPSPGSPPYTTKTGPPAKGAVNLLNQSGHAAVEVYLYPIGAPDRGPDLLGANELKAGATLTVPFDRAARCVFTAHVVYGGKTPDGELHDLDLCASDQVVLHP